MIFFGRDKIWIFAGFAIAVFIALCRIEMVFPVVIFLSGILIGLFLISLLDREERYFLTKIYFTAYVLRVVFSLCLYYTAWVLKGDGLFGDGYSYSLNGTTIVNLWMSGIRDLYLLDREAFRLSASGNLGPYDYWNAIVYFFTGSSPFTLIFINCIASSLTVILIYRITKHVSNIRAARFASFLMVFWPSAFFWSIQNLKEPLVALFIILLIWIIFRLKYKLRFYLIALMIASSVILKEIRGFLLLIFYFPILPLAFLMASKRKKEIFFLLVFFCFFGVYLIKPYLPEFFSVARLLEFIHQKRIDRAYGNLAFFANWDTRNPFQYLLFLPIGLLVGIFAPFPWQLGSLSQIASLPEMMIFYFLTPLMICGAIHLIKKNMIEGWVVVIYAFIVVVALCSIDGNIGTLFRHRAMVLPLFLVLISVGMDKCNFKVILSDNSKINAQ